MTRQIFSFGTAGVDGGAVGRFFGISAIMLLCGGPLAAQPTPAPDTGEQTVAPGNTAPERDARGIPVVSDPATAPDGANQPVTVLPGAQTAPAPNQAAAFATQPATEDYRFCSRTVTDNCMQSYEGPLDGPPASDPPFCPDSANPLCPRPDPDSE